MANVISFCSFWYTHIELVFQNTESLFITFQILHLQTFICTNMNEKVII